MPNHPLRKFFAMPIALLALAQPAQASPLFEGDQKLACEAILCLSSGSRPNECTPSLQRYFSIRHKKPGKTIEARHDFLRQCPSAQQDDRMRALVAAMANAAGSCQAETLNLTLRHEKEVTVCQTPQQAWARSLGGDQQEALCHTRTMTVIENTLPPHCKAYFGHAYIEPGDLHAPRYIGTPEKGGRWMD